MPHTEAPPIEPSLFVTDTQAMRTYWTLLVLSAVLLLVGFQNCSNKGFQAIGPELSIVKSSSMCSTQEANRLKVQALAIPMQTNCNEPGLYACIHRIFKPHFDNLQVHLQECLQQNATPSTCLTVHEIHFDTTAALSIATTEAQTMLVGGEFNHEEYQCYQTQALAGGQALFSAEGETLATAWRNTVQLCQARRTNAAN